MNNNEEFRPVFTL